VVVLDEDLPLWVDMLRFIHRSDECVFDVYARHEIHLFKLYASTKFLASALY